MDAIIIPQPWASLISLGFQDVWESSFHTDYRGPLFIVSAPDKADPQMKAEVRSHVWDEIFNLILKGFLPALDNLPTSSVVGIAHLTDCTKEPAASPWDGGGDQYRWHFTSARHYEPALTLPETEISGMSEAMGVYLPYLPVSALKDYVGGNLPDPVVFAREDLRLEGSCLTFPVSRKVFELMTNPEIKYFQCYDTQEVFDEIGFVGSEDNPVIFGIDALKLVTDDGEERFFGVEEAFILPKMLKKNVYSPAFYTVSSAYSYIGEIVYFKLKRHSQLQQS